jgi:hypothetical protein
MPLGATVLEVEMLTTAGISRFDQVPETGRALLGVNFLQYLRQALRSGGRSQRDGDEKGKGGKSRETHGTSASSAGGRWIYFHRRLWRFAGKAQQVQPK